jgi:tryptophan synthase alpha chain
MSGVERINSTFERVRPRAALMPYFTIGYPTLSLSLDIVEAIAHAGADLIELGIPFSDPLADGTTIQRSTQIALEEGMNVSGCLEFTAYLRDRGIQQPLILMGYINPILAFGLDRFVMEATSAGADGLIVPDLPIEETEEMEAACHAYGCAYIYMLAPTSSETRVYQVAEQACGFIYLVSVTGTTGVRESLPEKLETFVSFVRDKTSLPLAVGFGISTSQQAQMVGKLADGVIVGSALIDAVTHTDNARAPQAAAAIVQEMFQALQ